jgi:hypothetical protein
MSEGSINQAGLKFSATLQLLMCTAGDKSLGDNIDSIEENTDTFN